MLDGGSRSLDHRVTIAAAPSIHTFPVHSLQDVLRLAAAPEIALFKMDIEGGEHDVFAAASAEEFSQVARFAIEYHDNLRPGTLSLIQKHLSPTHAIRAVPHDGGYGMLYATRRSGLNAR